MEEFKQNIPKEIVMPSGEELIFGCDFSPQADLVALGTVQGSVKMYSFLSAYIPQESIVCIRYSKSTASFSYSSTEKNQVVKTFDHHKQAVRCVKYSPDGEVLFTASSDKALVHIDTATHTVLKTISSAHDAAINSMEVHENLVFTGDDAGLIKIWDRRKDGKAAIEVAKHTDYITDFTVVPDKHTLFSTAGDEHMAVIDYRKGKVLGFSQDQADELMSVTVVKHGSKVVVGSQLGVVLLFSWGQWLDTTDRFPGHPGPVNTMIPLDEDTVITGCEDGIIRLVNILPNKMLGVVGTHRRMPIENMSVSRDKGLLATVADNSVKFWNLAFLYEEEGDQPEDGESDNADITDILAGNESDVGEEGDISSDSSDVSGQSEGDEEDGEDDASGADDEKSDEELEKPEAKKKRKRQDSDGEADEAAEEKKQPPKRQKQPPATEDSDSEDSSDDGEDRGSTSQSKKKMVNQSTRASRFFADL